MARIDDPNLVGFRTFLSQKGMHLATIDSYCNDIKGFLSFTTKFNIPAQKVDLPLFEAFKQNLIGKKEVNNSIRRKVIGIRQYFRYLVHQNIIPASPLEFSAIPARNDTLAKVAFGERIATHLAQWQPQSLKEARDAAALSLFALDGIKVTELTNLEWHNALIDQNPPTLQIQGERRRAIRLDDLSASALQTYRNFYDLLVKKPSGMFVGFKGREAHLVLPRVSRHGIKFMLYEIGATLRIPHLNAEKLRHVAMERLILRGLSVEEIMNHLGLKAPGNIVKHMRALNIDIPSKESQP